jgi:hypothetical protein
MPEYTSTTVSRLPYGQYCALRKDNLVRMRIDDAYAPELIPYLSPHERFTHRLWSTVWMFLILGLAGLLVAQEFIIASGVFLLVMGMPKAIRSNTAMAIEAAGFKDPQFFELLNALKGVRFTVYSPKG